MTEQQIEAIQALIALAPDDLIHGLRIAKKNTSAWEAGAMDRTRGLVAIAWALSLADLISGRNAE